MARSRRGPGPVLRALGAMLLVMAVLVGTPMPAGAAPAGARLDLRYLDLPMPNRDASAGSGGVNAALPTDARVLEAALNRARSAGVAPHRYAALLLQFWLVRATDRAGIDLAAWNPRLGVSANKENLVRSYAMYEQLQLEHRELRWAGQGGQVGADFGGGLLDFELTNTAFALPGMAESVRALSAALEQVIPATARDLLPDGLRALLRAGTEITPADMDWAMGMILVMQKNIFMDLMPMHLAYVRGGLTALAEMHDAGLFGAPIMSAWRDLASADSGRITAGNAALLRREQEAVIGEQWNLVRRYHGDVGEAITYLSTVAGSPSVAGVKPPREYHPVRITVPARGGGTLTLTLPLPDWNWSVFDERWAYITSELVPKYEWAVLHDWPAQEAIFRTPYEIQLQTHRPVASLPATIASVVDGLEVQYQPAA